MVCDCRRECRLFKLPEYVPAPGLFAGVSLFEAVIAVGVFQVPGHIAAPGQGRRCRDTPMCKLCSGAPFAFEAQPGLGKYANFFLDILRRFFILEEGQAWGGICAGGRRNRAARTLLFSLISGRKVAAFFASVA